MILLFIQMNLVSTSGRLDQVESGPVSIWPAAWIASLQPLYMEN